MDQKPKFECGIILECIARRRRPLDGSRSRMVSGYRRDRRRFRKVDRFGMATLGGLGFSIIHSVSGDSPATDRRSTYFVLECCVLFPTQIIA